MTIPAADDPPSDPRTLQALVRELLEALAAMRRDNAALRGRLDQLLRRVYGPRSEKIVDPPQPDTRGPSDNVLSPSATAASHPNPVHRPRRAATAGSACLGSCHVSASSTT
jgi:hypothetical protein